MKFKIENIAVGTRNIPWAMSDLLLNLGDYVETAIEYNNDYLVGKNIPKDSKIITRLFDVENLDYLLSNHLKYLDRDYVDILLISALGFPTKEQYDSLGKYSLKKGLFGETLKPEDLEEYKKLFGEYPDYISIPLNPYFFKKELIDKAKEAGIKIISYEIFGGPLEARKMIGTFGLQFLARFAAYYSDIVCISSGANLEEEMILSKTLKDLIPDIDIPDSSNYSLNTSTNKRGLGVQRRIHTYSEIQISGKTHTFKNDYNGYIGPDELKISFQGNLENIPTIDMENLKESDNILVTTSLIMGEILKTEAPTRKEEVAPFYRYLVMNSLKDYYSGKRYKFKVSKIGHIFRVTIQDRLLFWKKSLEFLLVVSERSDSGFNVFFRNL